MVVDALPTAEADGTWHSLAALMNVEGDPSDPATRQWIAEHTLIRRIEHFDPDAIPLQRMLPVKPAGGPIRFETRARSVPDHPPPGWRIEDLGGGNVLVEINAPGEILAPDLRSSRVTSAGQLPTGFDPGRTYQSRSHPRGLQLTVWSASDALRSLGIDWQTVRDAVHPDEIAVYASSGMSQLDSFGNGGMLQAHLLGKRVTSKQLPLGLPQMPADFVNAYVLGSVGCTGANIGACATFLYNLRQGIDDIRSGRRRVVMVGNSEAPILPEVIEGYRTMGALAEDDALIALDGGSGPVDNRRASRPFSENCGFTLAEGAVYAILMDDDLALQLGANVLGAVGDVFINADGFKKSIPGPGIGNYITVAKAMACARALLGEQALARTFMQAHGTSTPQNRVTESQILDRIAAAFGIERWLVGAVKAYIGHSLSPAAGDQLAATLGAFAYGILPGITTVDRIADDVHRDHLELPLRHVQFGVGNMDAAFINSKGFGGNNATALVLAPHTTLEMLDAKHGAAAIDAWRRRNEGVAEATQTYDAQMIAAPLPSIYEFGEGVLDGDDLELDAESIRVPGFAQPINLRFDHPYPWMRR